MVKKTKILINCRDVLKIGGGTGVYVHGLITALDKQKIPNVEIFLLTPKRLELRNCKQVVVKNTNQFIFDFIFMTYFSITLNIDVLIGTKYFVPFVPGKKLVAVVHDLAYFMPKLNAYTWVNRTIMSFFLRITALYTNTYITVSENTKNDLTQYLHTRASIHTIHSGTGQFEKNITNKISGNKEQYLLFTGGISPRKNLERIVDAVDSLEEPIKLYITGARGWDNSKIIDKINKSKRVVRLGYLSENELKEKYANASIYLYPSLYEGFGLPILEAQEMGVPVITSNISSMPEVAGDGAYYVDPYSVDEIKSAITKILTNKKLRLDLVSKGYNNLKRFSWDKTAKETIDFALKG